MPEIQRTPPAYMQVLAHIRQQITSGEIPVGELVPSDRQIADDWGIARGTAAKVVTALRAEGLIETERGVGSRVVAPPAARGQHPGGHDRARAVRKSGRIYREGEYARIVTAQLTAAPDDVAQLLGLEPGAEAIQRVRVTYRADGTAVSSSTSWYRGDLAEAAPLLLVPERIKEGSWRYLEQQTGLTATAGQDRIRARLATPAEAEILGLEIPAAVKESRTVLRDGDAAAVEVGVSVSGPDRESVYDYDVSPS